MYRFVAIVCFYLIGSCSLFAKHISAETALQAASAFLSEGLMVTKSNTPALQLSHTAYLYKDNLRADNTSVGYYAFSIGNDEGFVVIAGDDRAYPILGYSHTGSFDEEQLPSNARYWLDGFCSEIESIIQQEYKPTETTQSKWEELLSGKVFRAQGGKLLKTASWGQGVPYNVKCPSIGGQRCLAGCVATAFAIVMKYYEWPKQGKGSHRYRAKQVGQYISTDFSVTYDWENMPDEYWPQWSAAQEEAISTLLYKVGVAVEMDYGVNESWATILTENIKKYFDYHPAMRCPSRDSYSDEEWIRMLREELDKDRPVVYRGAARNHSSHLFVCDGYDNNNLYHINWGWDGYLNGYFALSALDPVYGNNGYHMGQSMLLDFVPSTYEAKETYEIRTGRNDEGGHGIIVNVEEIKRNLRFNLDLNYLVNVGSMPFDGYIGIALTDKDDNILYVISDFKWSGNIPPGYHSNCWFRNAVITTPFLPTDKLRMVYSSDHLDWRVMKGGPNTTNEIILGNPIVPYYTVVAPSVKGVAFLPLAGYDDFHVVKNSDFKFLLALDEDYTGWQINVSSNGTPVQSIDGIYTIMNIIEDQTLKITLNPISTEPVESGTLQAYAQNGIITVYNVPAGSSISVYNVSGKLLSSHNNSTGTSLQIKTRERGIIFIKVDNQVIKVIN